MIIDLNIEQANYLNDKFKIIDTLKSNKNECFERLYNWFFKTHYCSKMVSNRIKASIRFTTALFDAICYQDTEFYIHCKSIDLEHFDIESLDRLFNILNSIQNELYKMSEKDLLKTNRKIDDLFYQISLYNRNYFYKPSKEEKKLVKKLRRKLNYYYAKKDRLEKHYTFLNDLYCQLSQYQH